MRTGAMLAPRVVMPEHAKVLRDVNRRMMRMYEAAVSNNLNPDFPIDISSANAEIFTSIMPARARARTLDRDNPYAKAIIRTFQNNVVGHDPFPLEMKVGKWVDGQFIEETETNRMIEEAWREAGLKENCTTRRDMSRLELDLQALSSLVRDGGYLGRHVRDFPNNKYHYALQPLEIDRLDHYWNGKNPKTGNDIKLSVELDRWGAPVTYWLLTHHPGDIFIMTDVNKKYREPVPAGDMIVLFDIRERAEQVAGMPRFSSVIAGLHRIDQFDIAHVTAAVWSACKPFFIIQEFPTAMEYVPDYIKNQMEKMGGEGEPGYGEQEGEKVSKVQPGEGEYLPYGQKPMLVDPHFPIEASSSFKKENLRRTAAGSGAPYHIIANDLESVNFSSGRLGLEEFRAGCKILQEHFIDNFRRPHFETWLEAWMLTPECTLPFTRLQEFKLAANFNGVRWDYIQPVQDAQADIMLIEAGITSRDAVIRERGGKGVEKVDSQIASDRKCDNNHGLDFTIVSKPTIPKGPAGESQDQDKPSDNIEPKQSASGSS